MLKRHPSDRNLRVFAWFGLVASLFAGVGEASAQGSSVQGEVLVILAHETEGTIHPTLSEITALRRPPFNVFHSMDLLARTPFSLVVGTPVELPLPNGRQLRIELQGTTADGRHRVRVSINRPGESDYLPLLSLVVTPGDPFFIAGQNFLDGTLVIGARIGLPRP